MNGKAFQESLWRAAATVALIPSLLGVAYATDLRAELVVAGLEAPCWVGAPHGDEHRLFVLEQSAARIRIVKDGVLLATPFLDLGAIASENGEQGLLGLAFHPDFAWNGRFFVDYTDTSKDTVIAEYRVGSDPDVADPNPVQQILWVDQPHVIHNGGCIAFGPDGMLYVGMGDGGPGGDPSNRAQDGASLLGKLLRLDVDRPPPFVPPDNPFVQDPLVRDEIWALGLRNPWRFGFDAWTGDLWIGDVGQADVEELDYRPGTSAGGENYGWRCEEGSRCTGLTGCTCGDGQLVRPIHEYAHANGDCAIIGGGVYRGAALPDLWGSYFFADYCSSRIWSMRQENGQVVELLDRTLELEPDGTPTIQTIHSFGSDGLGELYLVDSNGGEIYALRATCSAASYCEANPNSHGTTARLSTQGSFSIAANDFHLLASGASPSQPALFFYGAAPTQHPLGDGYLCVASDGLGTFRLRPPQQAAADGSLSRRLDFTQPPASSGPGQILPGRSWFAQLWYRDSTPAGHNLSDGLRLVFCP